MNKRYQILFLIFLILGIFYPTIFAESLSIDDQEMIRGLINTNSLNWQGLFWPHAYTYYYRPLLGLSFYCDHLLFNNSTSFAHLVNILVHLANTLLLFGILRTFVSTKENDGPLLATIFFGVHPLVAEPINWVSGRTDLLAGFFVLLSFLFFLRNREKKPGHDILAAFLFLCGLWSKEVAIGLLPVILFACLQEQHFAVKKEWRKIATRMLPFLVATLLYGLMRTGGHITHDIGVMTAIRGGHGAENYPLTGKFFSLIKVIGFYSQKILWPFPLNFAIVDINRPVALAEGIIALAGLTVALLYHHRRPFMLGLVWIICFLAPALPVAINRVAWTPLAERYLYLPLMGLSLIVVVLLTDTARKKTIALATILILFGFATATVQRNIIWQKNITLWKDVVKKSPSFPAGHNDYAVALLNAGKKQKAQKHFAIAESLAKGTGKSLAQSNLATQSGNFDQQLATLDKILQSEQSPKMRVQVLYKLIWLLNNETINTKIANEEKRALTKKMLHYQGELARLDKNPYHLYRIGQLHLALGEKILARDAFDKTCQASNDYFTQPSCTLAKRLAQETKGE